MTWDKCSRTSTWKWLKNPLKDVKSLLGKLFWLVINSKCSSLPDKNSENRCKNTTRKPSKRWRITSKQTSKSNTTQILRNHQLWMSKVAKSSYKLSSRLLLSMLTNSSRILSSCLNSLTKKSKNWDWQMRLWHEAWPAFRLSNKLIRSRSKSWTEANTLIEVQNVTMGQKVSNLRFQVTESR